MSGRQAKTLSSADVNDLLLFARCTRNPLRNRVLVLLSAKAGLRASEIANLTWAMVVDASGQISGSIELRDTAAKKGSGRMIPMHSELRAALIAWRQVAPPSNYVIASGLGGAMRPLSIVVWFNRALISEVDALLEKAAPLVSKVTFLRSNIFARRSGFVSYAAAFENAQVTADQLRDLTEIALQIANRLLLARGLQDQLFNYTPRQEAEAILEALKCAR